MCVRSKQALLLYFLLLSFSFINAQSRRDSANNFSITVQHHFGSFVTNAPKATYVRDSYSNFTEISIVRQTDGSGEWHRGSNYPRTGFGLMFGNIGSKQYVGKAISLYPFVSFPLVRRKIFSSSFKLGTGISAVEKPYDVKTNHKNTLIGSRLNNYIHVSFENEFQVSKPLRFGAGISFAHISNGNIKLPNYGLNFLLLSAGLRYVFNERMIRDTAKRSFLKTVNYRLLLSAGAKQTPWIKSPRYVVGVLSTQLVKTLTPASGFGGGVDIFLDPSLTRDPSGFSKEHEKIRNIQVGLHAFYERTVGRVTIPVQAGIYALHADDTKRFYQTIGLRYQLSPQLLLFYHLKTHGGKADFIHFGLGYTL
ncbi:MAG TPA: acyloxyacyl hydrolase [Flavisolibacter sp.]|nr:acyloxyacyl hydrolase [Flavisolibacter sp.]